MLATIVLSLGLVAGAPVGTNDVAPKASSPTGDSTVNEERSAKDAVSLPTLNLQERNYDLKHYAKYYGPEWALDIALLTTSLLTFEITPAFGPAIGPTYTPQTDASLLDPRLDGIIGKPFIKEQVSEGTLIAASVGTVLTFGVASGLYHRDFHHTHNFILGALSAITATQVTGHILKVSVGRLRPDFRDRYVRAACAGNISSTTNFDCEAVDDGFVATAKDIERGRRSFPSGHATLSFTLISYLGLHAGSSWIWGESVPKSGFARPLTQVAGVLAGGALLAGGTYVAASRVTDGRHHLGDVAFGAAMGSAFGAASYFLHFELNGDAKMRGTKISALTSSLDGVPMSGAQISGQF